MPSMGWSKEKHQDGQCEGCMSQSNILQSPPAPEFHSETLVHLWYHPATLSGDGLEFCFCPALGSPVTVSPLTFHLCSGQHAKVLPYFLPGLSEGQEPPGTSDPQRCCAAILLAMEEQSGYWEPDCPQCCSSQQGAKQLLLLTRLKAPGEL